MLTSVVQATSSYAIKFFKWFRSKRLKFEQNIRPSFPSIAYIANPPPKVDRLEEMVYVPLLCMPSPAARIETSRKAALLVFWSRISLLWISLDWLVESPPLVLYFIFVTAFHGLLRNLLRIGPSLRSVNEKFFITILFVKVSFNCCKALGTLGSRGCVTRPDGLSLLSNGHAHQVSRGLRGYNWLNEGWPTSSWNIEQKSVSAGIIKWLDGILEYWALLEFMSLCEDCDSQRLLRGSILELEKETE